MQKEKAKQIVGIILNNTWQSETTLDDYIPIPRNFWMKVIGSQYSKILKTLSEHRILHIDHSYSSLFKNCKKYRVNPSLMHPEAFIP